MSKGLGDYGGRRNGSLADAERTRKDKLWLKQRHLQGREPEVPCWSGWRCVRRMRPGRDGDSPGDARFEESGAGRAVFVAISGAANGWSVVCTRRGSRVVQSQLRRRKFARPTDWPAEVAWVGKWRKARENGWRLPRRIFFGAPRDGVEVDGRNRNKRQDHDDFFDRFDFAGFRGRGRPDYLERSAITRRVVNIPPRTRHRRSVDLQNFFAEIRDGGGTYATLGSEFACAGDGAAFGAAIFAAAVFTNLTREPH